MTTRKYLYSIVFLALIWSAAPAVAASPEAGQTAEDPALHQSLVNLSADQVAKLAPLPKRLREILLEEKETLATLREVHAQEKDPLRILEIQRQMQGVKIQTERALLEAQADHARQNGQAELAGQIEAALARMAERDRARQENIQQPTARR